MAFTAKKKRYIQRLEAETILDSNGELQEQIHWVLCRFPNTSGNMLDKLFLGQVFVKVGCRIEQPVATAAARVLVGSLWRSSCHGTPQASKDVFIDLLHKNVTIMDWFLTGVDS